MAVTKGEQYFLDRIKQGDEQVWADFVSRYRGRLVRFARAKLPQRADAEDVVQETFVAFLRSISRYRGECDLETYLFALIRRKIIDSYRSAGARRVCLIQDAWDSDHEEEGSSDLLDVVPSPAQTASWYARADEQQSMEKTILAEALSDLVDGLKKNLNLRDLQIIEMLFYCQIPNKDVAKKMGLDEKAVALIKHRNLKQIRENVGRRLGIAERGARGEGILPSEENAIPDSLLTDLWEYYRFSCPKRNTIGAYMLGTLEPDWHKYVEFHLNVLGCRFCRANLDDLQSQSQETQQEAFQARIMESTIGFLSRPM
ncbi:MAG TPA: sigma-70 family RNA polymerase sigma factor [Sedimentisphaerales bacterium]|jgi:RNA polymerase sigma factor (sigma-70 family)|nr:sigma-70 family RNA polymerase sigma factor [Sedimentisphaerales bacterium]HNU31380.1 sigma-70 family RNA polymerase sigma factor [Sedimentisphaerales bacterium]